MNRTVLAAFSIVMGLLSPAAAYAQSELGARIQVLEDRAALKNLVDTFSNLADQKNVEDQVLLFTEDATVESRSGGQPGSRFTGREEIGAAFSGYLANFETVYHINGQQTVEIDGDRATGISYSLVVLIGVEDGERIKNTSGVYYNDEYVRQDGAWLIANRLSNFTWRDREVMGE